MDEDYEYAEAKDFVYLLADKMIEGSIEVIDQDNIFKHEDRHKYRAIRRHSSQGVHDGHGVPTDDGKRTIRCEGDLSGQS